MFLDGRNHRRGWPWQSGSNSRELCGSPQSAAGPHGRLPAPARALVGQTQDTACWWDALKRVGKGYPTKTGKTNLPLELVTRCFMLFRFASSFSWGHRDSSGSCVCTGMCLLYCNTVILGSGVFLTEDIKEPWGRNRGRRPRSWHSLSAQPGQTARVSYAAVQPPYLAARYVLRKGIPGTAIVSQKWGLGFLPVHQF